MQTPRRVKKIRFDYSTYLFFWLLAARRCRRSWKIGFRFRLFNYLLGIVLYAPIRSCSFLALRFFFFFVSYSSTSKSVANS